MYRSILLVCYFQNSPVDTPIPANPVIFYPRLPNEVLGVFRLKAAVHS
jgi:hypothetical protein